MKRWITLQKQDHTQTKGAGDSALCGIMQHIKIDESMEPPKFHKIKNNYFLKLQGLGVKQYFPNSHNVTHVVFYPEIKHSQSIQNETGSLADKFKRKERLWFTSDNATTLKHSIIIFYYLHVTLATKGSGSGAAASILQFHIFNSEIEVSGNIFSHVHYIGYFAGTFIQSDLQLIRLSRSQSTQEKFGIKGLAQGPKSCKDLIAATLGKFMCKYYNCETNWISCKSYQIYQSALWQIWCMKQTAAYEEVKTERNTVFAVLDSHGNVHF